jgi:superfamily I DNA and/or RNA helicase
VREPYACFAAPLVAVTCDAVDDLPDVAYDLVIFEEASQLRFVKLLKVLTKVVRGRTTASVPAVLFCGDPRQLPPFYDSADAPRSSSDDASMPWFMSAEQRRDLASIEAPFERVVRDKPDSVVVLTRQCRMREAIARVTNSLFYADQTWDLTREGSGVVEWIDTALCHPQVGTEGASRYNIVEAAVVTGLVRRLRGNANRILVISPYAAQVHRLVDLLGEGVRVRTVDGCQGIDAETVIISFVSLTFSSNSDFVVEPRRMNVALSRARDRLYLIGSTWELRRSAVACGWRYPHMAGLAALVSEGRAIHVTSGDRYL